MKQRRRNRPWNKEDEYFYIMRNLCITFLWKYSIFDVENLTHGNTMLYLFKKLETENMYCICIIKSFLSWSLIRAHFIWGSTTDNIITCFWVGKKNHSKTIHILYSPCFSQGVCSNPCPSRLPPHSPLPKAYGHGDHLAIALTLVTSVSFCMEPE